MADITYEKAVEETVKRNIAAEGPGNPVPDQPRGVPHLNPAIHPAPVYEPKERPIPVPVINDPGLVGAAIPLADLNRAYREDDAERAGIKAPIDDTGGLTEEKQEAAIRKAAVTRQKAIDEKASTEARKAVAKAKGNA